MSISGVFRWRLRNINTLCRPPLWKHPQAPIFLLFFCWGGSGPIWTCKSFLTFLWNHNSVDKVVHQAFVFFQSHTTLALSVGLKVPLNTRTLTVRSNDSLSPGHVSSSRIIKSRIKCTTTASRDNKVSKFMKFIIHVEITLGSRGSQIHTG